MVNGPQNGTEINVSINDDRICFAQPIRQYGLAFTKQKNAPIRRAVYTRSKKDIRRFHFTNWE